MSSELCTEIAIITRKYKQKIPAFVFVSPVTQDNIRVCTLQSNTKFKPDINQFMM